MKKSKRYKIKIEILPNAEVKVHAPKFVNKEKILEKYKKWINKKVEFVKSVIKEIEGKENMFLYKGRFLLVERSNKNYIDHNKVYIYNMTSFREYLRNIAKKELEQRVERWSDIMNIKNYNKITIRLSKRVWGSCSYKNNLNFSIRLLALPNNLIDYIIIHELSHILHKNHSKAFWDLVRRYYPKYRESRKELEKYQIIIENNIIWKKILKL